MKKLVALLRVSLKAMLLTSVTPGRLGKKAATGLGAVALIALLGLYLSGLYSALLMGALAPLHMEALVFTFMGLGVLAGGLLFTTFAVKGVVFGGRDNDLLLSMPVPVTLLALSRVAAIYLENLLFSLFVLLPAGVVCTLLGSGGLGHSPLFWVRLLAAALLLPLLDTALAVLLGALAAFLSSRAPGGALGQNIVMGLFLAAVLYLSFGLNGMLGALAENADAIRGSLRWAAPLLWMGEGILGDWGQLLAFGACCLLPFLLVTAVLGRLYRRAVSAFAAKGARGGYRLSAQRACGQRRALLRKEARRFFGTPAYFWNAGLGLIMLLAAGIGALCMRERLAAVFGAAGQGLALPAAAAAIGFCLCACPIDAPSVSLEGRYLWILREAPLGEGALILVKVGFQLLLTLPCTAAGVIGIAAALRFPLWQGAALLVFLWLFAAWHAVFGMLMGLCFPQLDAVNEAVVIKQSLAVMLSIFVPMAALAAAGALYALSGGLAGPMGLGLPILLVAALLAVCAFILIRRGPAMLRGM